MILPLYISHVLQPLNVTIFILFKTALAQKTDTISRLNSQQLPRVK